MQKSNSNLVQPRASGTLGSLLVLVGFVLIGMVAGNVLAIIIISLFMSTDAAGSLNMLNLLLSDPDHVPNGWYAMMILQGTVHFFSYLFPSLLFWFFIERKRLSDFNFRKTPGLEIWLLGFILVLVFIPVNSRFIDWNAAMTLPQGLSWLEEWMRAKEDQLAVLTGFLTKYDRIGQLMIALFVVVLLPALGEEVLFRGIIQRKLAQHWTNVHLAIWVSAAIFSAIHFQFYGFIPRMLLGALFGYLYYWTGSLIVAVFAHFVNNGFVLVMMYLYNIKVLDINIEETKSMPVTLVLASAVLSGGILFLIRRSGRSRHIFSE